MNLRQVRWRVDRILDCISEEDLMRLRGMTLARRSSPDESWYENYAIPLYVYSTQM